MKSSLDRNFQTGELPPRRVSEAGKWVSTSLFDRLDGDDVIHGPHQGQGLDRRPHRLHPTALFPPSQTVTLLVEDEPKLPRVCVTLMKLVGVEAVSVLQRRRPESPEAPSATGTIAVAI